MYFQFEKLFSQPKSLESMTSSVAKSTLNAQVVVFKSIAHSKEPELFREMADSRSGAGYMQGEHGKSCHYNKESTKHKWVMSKELRNQLEGAPTSQRWDNLSVNKNKRGNRWKHSK